jgi:hypothetical protein
MVPRGDVGYANCFEQPEQYGSEKAEALSVEAVGPCHRGDGGSIDCLWKEWGARTKSDDRRPTSIAISMRK